MVELILLGDSAALQAKRAGLASGEHGDGGLVESVERAVAAAPRDTITFAADGAATVSAGGRRYAGGTFSLLSLSELRRRAVAVAGSSSSTGRVRLSVIGGADVLNDIGTLQGAAAEDTLFQVASQFNGLEAPNARVMSVSSYTGDPTQGPRAAYSAFPGTLVRHYAAPAEDGTKFVQSTRGQQIDLLAHALPRSIAQVRSGYLTAGDIVDPVGAATALDQKFDMIRVGVHDGIEVVFGHNWHGPIDGAPRIAQVLTSTLAASTYSVGLRIEGPFALICRQLLRAAYLGTLLAAVALGKRAVVLTLIGGGAFGNPRPMIWDAIEWACGEVGAIAGHDLHVVVNNYAGIEDRPRVLRLVQARAGMLAEIREGRVTITA